MNAKDYIDFLKVTSLSHKMGSIPPKQIHARGTALEAATTNKSRSSYL